MANIKELKKKIKSTKGTFKITKAMKLVSAAKLGKAQSRILGLRPYSTELEETVKTVSALSLEYKNTYFTTNPENKQAIVLVISSDKGLCGGYNSQLAKTIKRFTLEERGDEDLKFVWIGKKVRDLLQKEVNSGKTFTFTKNEPTYEEVRKVADELGAMFISGEVGKVYVAYNSFVSAIAFDSKVRQLLPMQVSETEIERIKSKYPYDFKYEPGADEILDTLVPEVYLTTVYTCVLDAIASEHGSRMNAMENASKNSKEVIKKLSLKMNKMRQARITTELIEVVSGAESLNG
ncbi:MAG TPA: ATP synthase F1 subunit gamma [Bacteriovoracaceae bacterium]|nr:ATP synthase F1 subunit gamma [Bacteriovoracaceae bacterium]